MEWIRTPSKADKSEARAVKLKDRDDDRVVFVGEEICIVFRIKNSLQAFYN